MALLWEWLPSGLLYTSTRCATTQPTLSGLTEIDLCYRMVMAAPISRRLCSKKELTGWLPGHASMFLYVMNYLVGYDAWTIDELKGYASPNENGYRTLCHGHPERQTPAVEVTTGPLGQGVANAVGLAIASKNLAANFNKPGYELVQSTIWCTTGDGCLMEGVALEGMALECYVRTRDVPTNWNS